MARSHNRRRPVVLAVRLTEAEHDAVRRYAAEADLTVPDYVRRRLLADESSVSSYLR